MMDRDLGLGGDSWAISLGWMIGRELTGDANIYRAVHHDAGQRL